MDKQYIDSLTFHGDRALPPNLIHSMDAKMVMSTYTDARHRMYHTSVGTTAASSMNMSREALMSMCYGAPIHDSFGIPFEWCPVHGWPLFKRHVRKAVNILTAKNLRTKLRAKLRRLAAKRLNLYTSKTCVGCDTCMYDE